ncbi:MAG: Phosphoenolpyruvate-protein phosphotransferase [Firmicutes bacterium]|nr:Phosphoenolpyruvate-protein phosphotransferase [Bacillota bacterium]
MDTLRGRGIVAGVAIGKIMFPVKAWDAYLAQYQQGTVAEETQKYHAAHRQAVQGIADAVVKAKATGSTETATILEAHQSIITDPVLEESILGGINSRASAPLAVRAACEEIAAMFLGLQDPYLRERAADIRDIGSKMASLLLAVPALEFPDEATILCATEIAPSVVANLPEDKVVGLILGQGSETTHAIIMAKARGLVTIVGLVEGQLDKLTEGTTVILDGTKGEVIVEPTPAEVAHYQALGHERQVLAAEYARTAAWPAKTTNGKRIIVAANIGNPLEIEAAVRHGCEGVGLFRTEFIFMGRDSLPSEQEQYEAYAYVVKRCQEHLCVIRTLDIGGDKPLPYLTIPKEENPYLGLRAIRISLQRPDLFLTQVRAILRASAHGNVALMLPMIINQSEIVAAKRIINRAKSELLDEGVAVSTYVPVGIMVETPAAAVMAPTLAEECDFFSIGTNDLTQYTLAVDRGNQGVSYLYDHFNPAVLRFIAMTIKAAHARGIWVGVCGEMAGDRVATELLVSMGIDELSMSAPAIPLIKEAIRHATADESLARQVLTLHDVENTRAYLGGLS